MVYGVSALVGVMLGGAGAGVDRVGSRTVQAVALPLMAAVFALLPFASLLLPTLSMFSIIPLRVLWRVSAWSFFPAQQNRLIGVVGLANTPLILSLNASFMYFGFSAGAVLGSLVINLFGVIWIAPPARSA